MDLYEAIYRRQSIRSFEDRDISDEAIKRLISAACQAPSAGNLQTWRFYVVKDKEKKEDLARAALNQHFVSQAPAVIVVCADLALAAAGYGERGVSLFALQDTAAAIENLLLAAYGEGLGACWVGSFDEEEVRDILRLSTSWKPVAIIPLGYPKRMEKKPRRKMMDEVTTWII
jgi:nitroreductase